MPERWFLNCEYSFFSLLIIVAFCFVFLYYFTHFLFKVETTRNILSFHREDRSSDPNSPQSILLDFISSCQNLRIWSLNPSTREYLNSEQLQKGKQIDEWWRKASKGTCTSSVWLYVGQKCSELV